MSAHTPWVVQTRKGRTFVRLQDSTVGETTEVCLVYQCKDTAKRARLIAAAPKMYAMLERLAKLRNGLVNSSSSAEFMAAELADEAHRFIHEMTGVSL